MAHLLEQEAKEEIAKTVEEESAAEEAMEEEVHITASIPVAEESAPNNMVELAHRLGLMEARMETMAAQLAASATVIREQEQELTAQHEQMEIQEEVLNEVARAESEEGHHLSLWEKLMGGHRKD